MKVSEAVKTRRSVRGFLDRPVDPATVRRVLERAARAPSGGNLQPWHLYVLGGAELDQLKAIMARRVVEAPKGDGQEYDVYPRELADIYKERRFQVGEELYSHIGIARDDRAGRAEWFARNYQFFGAPVALFVYTHRQMGPPQWADIGMYLQSVMLLLREEGLDSCPQEAWAIYYKTVGEFLGVPPELMLWTGLAIGYADPDEPANKLYARRAGLEEFAEFRGM